MILPILTSGILPNRLPFVSSLNKILQDPVQYAQLIPSSSQLSQKPLPSVGPQTCQIPSVSITFPLRSSLCLKSFAVFPMTAHSHCMTFSLKNILSPLAMLFEVALSSYSFYQYSVYFYVKIINAYNYCTFLFIMYLPHWNRSSMRFGPCLSCSPLYYQDIVDAQ